MTKEQVNAIFSEIGEVTDTWVTLEGKVTHITLQCDNVIVADPQTTQWYFDSTNELIFIRYTMGIPKRFTSGEIPKGYVAIPHTGESYLVKLEEGGAEDVNLGRFHEALSYDLVVAFTNKK